LEGFRDFSKIKFLQQVLQNPLMVVYLSNPMIMRINHM
jgi:hypothetical protein